MISAASFKAKDTPAESGVRGKLARRKWKGKKRSKGRGGRTRSAAKEQAQRPKRTTIIQHSKRTTITIKTRGRRGSERTTIYEEDYEQEW